MKRLTGLLTTLLGLGAAAANTSDVKLDTPEDAVRSLERAYVQKDIESAVAWKDFMEEARLMLLKLHSGVQKIREQCKRPPRCWNSLFGRK